LLKFKGRITHNEPLKKRNLDTSGKLTDLKSRLENNMDKQNSVEGATGGGFLGLEVYCTVIEGVSDEIILKLVFEFR